MVNSLLDHLHGGYIHAVGKWSSESMSRMPIIDCCDNEHMVTRLKKLKSYKSKRTRQIALIPLSLLLSICACCAVLQSDVGGTQAGGSVIKVGPSQNLQAAINRARPGDIIELEAGKAYEGS